MDATMSTHNVYLLQVVVAVYRFSSNRGPWQGLDLFRRADIRPVAAKG
jgi:hypothetical protein